VAEQDRVVGHAVRAMYLYSAMADLAAEDADPGLLRACERLWDNLTAKKLYLTGGLGSDPSIEGFGADYDLPDALGYAETCAAIGLVLWAQRMANLSGDARYADVMERALYNAVLSGASADGTRYFYDHPLASDGSVHRHEWFGVACCPPNFARLLSSLEYYTYAYAEGEAVINLFVAGSARFRVGGRAVQLTQRTAYPADGRVTIDVQPESDVEFTISIRLPAWCGAPTVVVNGSTVDVAEVRERGYARLTRRWVPGDRISVELPMPPRRIWAHPAVASAAGRVALQRGPIVYCLEGVDHDVPVHALVLARDAAVSSEPDGEFGVAALAAPATVDMDPGPGQALYRPAPPARQSATLRAVPYFGWANRGRCDMVVWIRDGASEGPES
jgi:DUF1680 family protein